MLWGFLGALGGMVFYAIASVAQGYAAHRRTGPAVLRHPAYIAGLACDGIAWIFSLVALARLPLFVAQALLAGSLALTVLLAIPVLHIRPTRREVAAIAATTLGLVIVSASAGAESSAPSPHWFGAALWIVLALVIVAGALTYRGGRAVPIGALAGLAYSVSAMATRASHFGEHLSLATLRDPLTWVLLLAGGVGVLLYARALEGGVGPATAALWVVEVVVPGIIGVAVLGDPIRPGWFLPALAGVALCVGGCLVLAPSEAQG